MDFSGLAPVREWLEFMFDHTFLSSLDDPYLKTWKKLSEEGQIKLRILPNVGMEGTADYVWHQVSDIISAQEKGRVTVKKVQVFENEKNSAIYIPPRIIDHAPV